MNLPVANQYTAPDGTTAYLSYMGTVGVIPSPQGRKMDSWANDSARRKIFADNERLYNSKKRNVARI